ncbi:MAG: glycoside hydrolase N-terminal domain-containing protein [Eubacteriales bacterium]|nr:glycoside hydrolase N-terminal domain-containing protein [Eubacteriales bacterium]
MQLKLNRPAVSWFESFPMGNGHFGAMVYGDAFQENIELSALTFFSGAAQMTENCPAQGWQAFEALRQATLAGDFARAKRWTNEFMGIRRDFGTNLAVGRLTIQRPYLPAQPIAGSMSDHHERTLEINTGLCTVRAHDPAESTTTIAGHDFFASHIDRALIGRLWPGPDDYIQAVIQLEGECLGRARTRLIEPDETAMGGTALSCAELVIEGQALESLHSGGTCGARIALALRAYGAGGQVDCASDRLIIKRATDCLLVLTLETDFEGSDPLQSARERQDSLLESVASESIEPPGRSLETIWQHLFGRHRADFCPLMDRVKLRLGPHDPEQWIKRPEQNVAELKEINEQLALTAQLFQYGRYLLASSSREDSPIPAPLQGVWNDQVASRIGWSCDMHLDINTQMNHWPAESTNLPECTSPLFRWLQERLIPAGQISAQSCYNRPGWVAELVSNAWGFAAPYWSPVLSPCPTGGAWLINQVWEHYRYQPDLEELSGWILPVLAGAAEFFSAYLFERPGSPWLASGPSISPENEFLVDGESYYASLSCTYEITIIRDVFTSYDQACRILDDHGRMPESERSRWSTIQRQLPLLPPFRILGDGSLAEWEHDFPAKDPQHRHTSHLLALFPYGQITPERTPDLAAAAAVSIRQKLEPEQSWEDTGWARSLLMLYASRLHDGAAAWEHMQAMFRHLTQPNLLVRHPPTRGAPSFADVYELDGNTGLSACIADLLLQSHLDVVELLPSLPPAWREGEVRGLRARGWLQIDLRWQEGRLLEAILHSSIDQMREIRYHQHGQTVRLAAGSARRLVFDALHKT